MLYRNTNTGAIINVSSELGKPWEPVGGRLTKPAAAAPEPTKEKAPTKRTTRKTKK